MARGIKRERKSVALALAEIETRIIGSELLSDEEKTSALKKAREHVQAKRKEDALKKYLDAAIQEEERATSPFLQYEDIVIDLPEFTPNLVIDGKAYYHGLNYEVDFYAARTMDDIMARAWEHQREIDGRRRKGDLAMKPRGAVLGEHNAAMPVDRINTTAGMQGR